MMSAPPALRAALLALVAATLGACSSGPWGAAEQRFSARLAGTSEVPANASPATGTLEATLDRNTHLLRWTLTYAGLSGPVKAGHFHGPAVIGQNAGVVVPFTSSLDNPIEGQATVTPEQVADLMAGKWYVNLHTANFPAGELRGQVTPNR